MRLPLEDFAHELWGPTRRRWVTLCVFVLANVIGHWLAGFSVLLPFLYIGDIYRSFVLMQIPSGGAPLAVLGLPVLGLLLFTGVLFTFHVNRRIFWVTAVSFLLVGNIYAYMIFPVYSIAPPITVQFPCLRPCIISGNAFLGYHDTAEWKMNLKARDLVVIRVVSGQDTWGSRDGHGHFQPLPYSMEVTFKSVDAELARGNSPAPSGTGYFGEARFTDQWTVLIVQTGTHTLQIRNYEEEMARVEVDVTQTS